MKKIYLLCVFVLFHGWGFGQVSLPIDFEAGTVGTPNYGPGSFTSFEGTTTATVENNPLVNGDNPSAQVGRIVRANASDYDGGYLDLSAPLIFTATSTICMKVYTTAPVGTPVVLKLEAGPAFVQITQNTTVSGGWHTLCFDPPGAPTNYTRLTFLFNLPTPGTGTYYFDDIRQPGVLPITFEEGAITNADFVNVNGGVGTVIPNPQQIGDNTSLTVGQIVRNGANDDAGASIDLQRNVNLDFYPVICMKVFTTAPVGTNVTLQLEDTDTSLPPISRNAVTSGSEAWETLCFAFSGEPEAYDLITFLFDLGNVGDGTATSTFLFDDVEQLITPLLFGPGSQFFCPPSSVTLDFSSGSGNYNWYSDAAGTVLVQENGGNTFTTPILNTSTPYWVRDMDPTPLDPDYYGPSAKGSNTSTPTTVSTFFTSNLDNGMFYAADMVQVVIGTPAPCTFTMSIYNLTQGTNRIFPYLDPDPTNAAQITYTFPDPLPIFLNDQLELRITSSGSPCFVQSTVTGNSGLFLPFPNSFDPQITFTGHTTNGVADVQMSGMNFFMDGDFVNPTLFQINAIEDACANPLPIELLDFSVREQNGAALLAWSTASEINNDRFLLFRTSDGIDFERVGVVSGAGNSSTVLHYSFLDHNPLKGVSYYKLTQVDFDGTEWSSELVAFNNESSGAFRLFPNPTSEDLTLTLNEGYDRIEVRVYDLSGRLIDQFVFASAEIATFQLQGHPGAYFLEVVADDHRKAMFKVLKL